MKTANEILKEQNITREEAINFPEDKMEQCIRAGIIEGLRAASEVVTLKTKGQRPPVFDNKFILSLINNVK